MQLRADAIYVWGTTTVSASEAEGMRKSGMAATLMPIDWPPEPDPPLYLMHHRDTSELGYCPYCGHNGTYGLIMPGCYFIRCPKCREPGK